MQHVCNAAGLYVSGPLLVRCSCCSCLSQTLQPVLNNDKRTSKCFTVQGTTNQTARGVFGDRVPEGLEERGRVCSLEGSPDEEWG